jgi:ribulose-phosphate 3-epimerase
MATDIDVRLAVSARALNWARLEEDARALASAGAAGVWLDVRDGRFAPGYGPGVELVEALSACCGLPVAAHLMVDAPDDALEAFIDAGCTAVAVHIEAAVHVHRTLTQIREAGASPAIAIRPGTPLTDLEYVLSMVDRILVLTAEPAPGAHEPHKTAFERVGILKENLQHLDLNAEVVAAGPMPPRDAALLVRRGAAELILPPDALAGAPAADAFKAFRDKMVVGHSLA